MQRMQRSVNLHSFSQDKVTERRKADEKEKILEE